jgi:hypothetical protein
MANISVLYSLLLNSRYTNNNYVNLNEGLLIFEKGLFVDTSRNIRIKNIFFNELIGINNNNINIRIGTFNYYANIYYFAKIIYKISYYETFIATDLIGLLCTMNNYLIDALLQWFILRITGDVINDEFIFIFDGKIENFIVEKFVIEYFYRNCKCKFGSVKDYFENFMQDKN